MVYVPPTDSDAIAYLQSPQAIRDRSGLLWQWAIEQRLPYFTVDMSRLDAVADYVMQVTQQHYPTWNVPFHSRWRHFEAGGIPRLEHFQQQISSLSAVEQARSRFDLAILSVLLDAGAGSRWHYHEAGTGMTFSRSEGLAIASYRMFCEGRFSSDADQPYRADGSRLMQLTVADLQQGFQVTDDNPLVGLEGRLQLLQKLGQALYQHPDLFGEQSPRPGGLVDYLLTQTDQGSGSSGYAEVLESSEVSKSSASPDSVESVESSESLESLASPESPELSQTSVTAKSPKPMQSISAVTVLQSVLQGLGSIWPGRIAIANQNLGDVWRHPALEDVDATYPYVPFHKLSQWLTYSLLEPLEDLGLAIADLDQLTGLAEYRNGGLCLDLELLQLKQPHLAQQAHRPHEPLIVEWRALTVIALDQIAQAIRQRLPRRAAELPLVKILQGGTWAAGRQIAAQQRDGTPPLQIESDGTVF